MTERNVQNKHSGKNQHSISKDLLTEEFGHELGSYNSGKIYEILSDSNKKQDKKKEKEQD